MIIEINSLQPSLTLKRSSCMKHFLIIVKYKISLLQSKIELILSISHNIGKLVIGLVKLGKIIKIKNMWSIGKVAESQLFDFLSVLTQFNNWLVQDTFEFLLFSVKFHWKFTQNLEGKRINLFQIPSCLDRVDHIIVTSFCGWNDTM